MTKTVLGSGASTIDASIGVPTARIAAHFDVYKEDLEAHLWRFCLQISSEFGIKSRAGDVGFGLRLLHSGLMGFQSWRPSRTLGMYRHCSRGLGIFRS